MLKVYVTNIQMLKMRQFRCLQLRQARLKRFYQDLPKYMSYLSASNSLRWRSTGSCGVRSRSRKSLTLATNPIILHKKPLIYQ